MIFAQKGTPAYRRICDSARFRPEKFTPLAKKHLRSATPSSDREFNPLLMSWRGANFIFKFCGIFRTFYTRTSEISSRVYNGIGIQLN